MEKEIIDVLTLIYSNYELGFYNTTNEMALDLSKLIYNYKNNIDIRIGFEKLEKIM